MLHYIKKPNTDDEIYAILHPYFKTWFKKKFGSFSAPQQSGIIPIHEKKNTLIFAPTGTGKTLTAFTSILNELMILADQEKLEDRVYCVYVSPLKALSRDIKVNLEQPLQAIKKLAAKDKKKLPIRVATRTGDTSSYEKAKMSKKPPHILITTPESLAIVLTTKKFTEHLNNVDYVIIDEIHALAESKRGTHLSLSLERLRLQTQFTRIGLSATVAPLDKIAQYLVGYENGILRECHVVDAQFVKNMDLKVLSPVADMINTTHEKLHKNMYQLIDDLVQSHKTTLIFTNTRSATERVVHNLKSKFPKHYAENLGENDSRSLIGAHHGSLSATHRKRIETQLKNGQLKCIVSSTSLEMGIDIGYIDLVILLGSPKSVARALQRIGRSGHKLHETAKGRIIVLDRDDLVECAVLLKAAIEKKIDKVSIPTNCLDVLAQQIYGIAIQDKLSVDAIFELITQSYSYHTLSRKDFDAVMKYLAGEHVSLEERHVYAKIYIDEQTNLVGRRGKLARMIYMTNIGTIPDESYVTVKIGDEIVGKIDEGFLEKLKRGDVFVLGGETYEFLYARGMSAVVKTSAGRPPTVPSWFSEMLPLSFDLANEISLFRGYMEDLFAAGKTQEYIIKKINEYLYVDTHGAQAVFHYFAQQFSYAKIPHSKRIVIEHFKEDNTKYVVFHSLYGRRVNDVLSRAVAYVIGKAQGKDVDISISDNGFLLTYHGTLQARKALMSIEANNLPELMEQALAKTEVLKRRFRHCASRGLMILRSYMGRKKTVGRQQVGSMLLLKAVERISKDFPMLLEAKREVLEDLMDIDHAVQVLELIEQHKIQVTESYLDYPSPFSFHLVMQGFSDIFKIEDRMEFLRRMHEKVMQNLENPKQAEQFNYHELYRLAQQGREEQKEKQTQELKSMTNTLPFPSKASQYVNAMIDNKPLEQEIIDEFKAAKQAIALEYPEELRKVVFMYIKNHDYQSQLLQQLKLAAKKTKLDSGIEEEAKQIIMGKRNYISRAFTEWLDALLNGTISYAWKKDIVKFFMQIRDDMKD